MHLIIDTMHTSNVANGSNYLMINVGGFRVRGETVKELQAHYNDMKATHNLKGQIASVYKFVGGVGQLVRSEVVA